MALVKLLALTILMDFGDRASGDFMERVLVTEVGADRESFVCQHIYMQHRWLPPLLCKLS